MTIPSQPPIGIVTPYFGGLVPHVDCEPSELSERISACLKAPHTIASSDSAGLLQDLQNRGSIVFCDRFFDAKCNQIQDMHGARDQLPATVLMVNAMNTSDALSDLLRQGDIPRLLNQEIRERKQHKKAAEPPPKVVASSSTRIAARPGSGSSSSAFDPDASDPRSEPNWGEKRKDGHSYTPSPSTTLAQGLGPMLNGDVLHPFCPQSVAWDDLWLEQDHGSDLRVFVGRSFRNPCFPLPRPFPLLFSPFDFPLLCSFHFPLPLTWFVFWV